MTSFVTQSVCGPVIGSMVSSDKGNVKNKRKCAGAQLGNNLSTMAQNVGVGLGAFGAAKYIAKSPARIDKLANFFNKMVSKLPQSKLVQTLLNQSKKCKAAALIALPAIALVNFITTKHFYKMGQIDQKYTDQAKIEENTKNNILA